MRQPLTSGVICAALTPFDADDAPSAPMLVAHCRWLLDAGCSGVLLLGTSGEANSLTLAERQSLLEGVVASDIPAERLIVGTGCCATGDSVALTKHALSLGVRRALMLPPFYYKGVADAGVIEAYSRTIEAVDDPRMALYLYNIPQMSGVPITPAILDGLLERYPGIVSGLKDSSREWAGIEALCSRFGTSIDVLAGSERYLVRAMAAGASGCISATANVTARLIVELYQRRDDTSTHALAERVIAARDVFEAHPTIAALKEVTAARTGDDRWRVLRPPLTRLSAEAAAALTDKAVAAGGL